MIYYYADSGKTKRQSPKRDAFNYPQESSCDFGNQAVIVFANIRPYGFASLPFDKFAVIDYMLYVACIYYNESQRWNQMFYIFNYL